MNKLNKFKIGDKVYDRWWPEHKGEITAVLKTRLKVYFYSDLHYRKDWTYDIPHTQFLEKTKHETKLHSKR
jgi:hypothetical protein